MPPDTRKGTAKEFFGAEFRPGPPSFVPTLLSAVDVRGHSSLPRAWFPARLYQGKSTFEIRCRRGELSYECPGRCGDRGFSRAPPTHGGDFYDARCAASEDKRLKCGCEPQSRHSRFNISDPEDTTYPETAASDVSMPGTMLNDW